MFEVTVLSDELLHIIRVQEKLHKHVQKQQIFKKKKTMFDYVTGCQTCGRKKAEKSPYPVLGA